MRKRGSFVLLLLGAALLCAALLLAAKNRREETSAGEAAAALLVQAEQTIAQHTASPVSSPPAAPDAAAAEETLSPSPSASPSAAPEGPAFLGVLSVPAVSLTVPVLAEWSYYHLTLAPCRDCGSIETGDLVIAAHNYDTHFGRLSRIAPGDSVYFTDMAGSTTEYAAASVEQRDPSDAEGVRESGYPLVLYTCSWDCTARVTVFCGYA